MATILLPIQEEVADCEKRSLQRTPSEMLLIVVLRLFTNLVVLVILCMAGYVIYLAANWSLMVWFVSLDG